MLRWIWSKTGRTTSVTGLLNWLYLIKESMESTDFWNGDKNSGQLITIGGPSQK